MDQRKIGSFLRELRKEKGHTQEEFAEIMRVSNRTVSRWETGGNMPDLSILIEIADYYDVDIRELLDGERRSERMDKDVRETALKAADYNKNERKRLMKRLHVFAWIGVIAFAVFIGLGAAGLAENGVTEKIADFCGGFAFGMLLVAVIYTSPRNYDFMVWKRNMLHRGQKTVR